MSSLALVQCIGFRRAQFAMCPKLRYLQRHSFRMLHAQWSVLLDHAWYIPKFDGKKLVEVEETDEPLQEADLYEQQQGPPTTILLVHALGKDRGDLEPVARVLVGKSTPARPVQALAADLRGHGGSDPDDAAPPHTAAAAAADLLELAQVGLAAGGGAPAAPAAALAADCPGARAVAVEYLRATLLEGGVSAATFSPEAGGAGALPPPAKLFFLEEGCGSAEEKECRTNTGEGRSSGGSSCREDSPASSGGNDLDIIVESILASVDEGEHQLFLEKYTSNTNNKSIFRASHKGASSTQTGQVPANNDSGVLLEQSPIGKVVDLVRIKKACLLPSC